MGEALAAAALIAFLAGGALGIVAWRCNSDRIGSLSLACLLAAIVLAYLSV